MKAINYVESIMISFVMLLAACCLLLAAGELTTIEDIEFQFVSNPVF